MTSTFRGKWTFLIPNSKKYVGYVGSETLLVMRQGPGKETYIVFVLRTDKELCFFLQNGKYVEPGPGSLPMTEHREIAGVFDFPGHDFTNLPTSFTSKIHSAVDNSYLFATDPFVIAGKDEHVAHVFTITQHTPTLEQIQTSTKGDGLDLAGVDLTGGELDRVSLVGTDFSHSNLNTVKLTNCTMSKALLNNCTMVKTDLSGSNLSGANLNELDLTNVVIGTTLPQFCTNPDQAPSTTDPRTTFFKSTLNQSLLGLEWSKLDLRGTTMKFESQVYTKDKHITAKHSIFTGLNQNILSDLQLQYANFDHAVLDNVDLSGCDFTLASLQFASMHQTVLSDATLKSANLTGAQLGSLSQLFTLPSGFEKTHLNTGPVDAELRNQFMQNGVTLAQDATLSTQAQGRVWDLNDSGHNTYTIRLEGDSSPVLTVYKPGVAASLANAYMPDANLSGANLYGVIATGAQFYGSKASIERAILEKVEFNSANLSTCNFTQAQMRGANLSGAQLFNAKFNNANLSPSADGVATNLSNSNLQGADFTDAQLFGANLANAAVAIPVPTKVNPNQGGVYLFSLPCKTETATLNQYTAELTAAAKTLILPFTGDKTTLEGYKTALKTNDMKTLLPAFMKVGPVIFKDPVFKTVEADKIWQVSDATHSYNFWIAIDPSVDPDKDPDKGKRLFLAASILITQAGFKKCSFTLQSQASSSVDTANQLWLLDNNSEDPENFTTGYMRFIIKLNGNVLDVYGSALRILRLGDKHEEEYDTETCQITQLHESNMNADTVCPNGAPLHSNQSKSGKPWDTLWMHSPALPTPPTCVPTDVAFCPDKPKKKK